MGSPSPAEKTAKRARIRDTIRNMDSLPTLPSIITEFEEVIRNSGAGAGEVAAVIEKDVATAAKILKVVNSTYYRGSSGEIADLRVAIARLGMLEVKRLVMTLSLVSVFPNQADHVSPEEFWRHSLAAAGAARQLALEARSLLVPPEDAYTAGLLHDVGWLVMDQYLPGIAVSVVRQARKDHTQRREAELEVLGTDHGEIGGLVLERWRLPETIVEAVSWHHEPDASDEDCEPFTRLLHAADIVCRAAGIGDSGEGPPEADPLETLYALGLEPTHARRLAEELTESARRTAEILSLAA